MGDSVQEKSEKGNSKNIPADLPATVVELTNGGMYNSHPRDFLTKV